MAMEILTKEDLNKFKAEFFYDFFKEFDEKVQLFIQKKEENQEKEIKVNYIKSAQVMRLLKIAPSTLYLKRINGEIPFTKIGNTIYYDERDILELLKRNKNFIVQFK